MAKRKPDTGAIYISPRLRASLEPVGRCALTVVTAPMGYGKTTAVNWFLGTQPPAVPSASASIPTVCPPCGKAAAGPSGMRG